MNHQLKTGLFFILFVSFVFSSCNYNRNKAKPDIWDGLDWETNTTIRNLYAGPTELLVVTDDEFLRVGNDNSLLERRPILLPLNFFGRPSVSRYSFVRLVGTTTVSQLMEVHLTKKDNNPTNQVYEFDLDQLRGDSISLSIEGDARYNGAYNDEGTQFLLPMLNSTSHKYSLFLFDINFNFTRTEILSVTVNKKIDLPLSDVPKDLMNTRFINGNFYVTSKWGTFRIEPTTGNVRQINQIWTFDIFGHGDDIYLTGFNDFDFYRSDNDGLTFEHAGTSPLKFVEVENGQIFAQNQLGLPWKLADDDMFGADDLRVNNSFIDDGASYWNVKHFYGRYYLSIQKELYYLEELETE